ncbi:prolyl oligopeptidase family serine peptidase [Shewanella gaetbuli]|uniref:Prolyl oligopeptidase family serine peptidase n=2 Tax=Shewanella gaetbuli TaxID=220752 RepID=A0A9X2CJ39_9GAMM|nr:prolyl oligopeptidase family serine peptidase [Shewanella gaetbuli]
MKLSRQLTKTLMIVLTLFSASPNASPLSLNDIMHFNDLQKPQLADNGKVMAVEAKPDRGESYVIVKSTDGKKSFDIAGGTKPAVSRNGQFVSAIIPASLLDKETKKPDELTQQLALLDVTSGSQQIFDNVKSASFSDNGEYLAVWFKADKNAESAEDKDDSSQSDNSDKQPKVEKDDEGSKLVLIHLASKKQTELTHVTQYTFDESGNYFAASVNDHSAKNHQLIVINLTHQSKRAIYTGDNEQIGELALSNDGRNVAFTSGSLASKRVAREYQLHIIDITSGKHRQPKSDNWTLNQFSTLMFSRDNERLFVGRVPQVSTPKNITKYTDEASLFDQNIITANKNLRVWHGDDPKIKPQEVKEYKDELKRTYLAVYHIQADRIIQLADKEVPTVHYGEQHRYLVATSDVPYQKMVTWAGFYQDIYLVDLNTGRRILVLAQQPTNQLPTLSPNGKFLNYYQQGNIFVYDIAQARSHNLTAEINTTFANEDHDYPSAAPGYGFGPWLENDSGFIAYDKYDAWQFNIASNSGFMLTAGKGREQQVEYRIQGLVEDKQPTTLKSGELVLLKGYSHITKADGIFQAKVGEAGVTSLTDADSKLTVLARAKDAQTILYSSERFDLYPDIYAVIKADFDNKVKLTDLDSQRQAFDWGKAELVSWTGGDGEPIDGVLIKPSNYQQGQTYPVMVYYYRFMSDRLHSFPDMKINHRPNFAWYTNNGYAIFLPDIRFEIGYPGISAVKALTSGVQKIIDMGIADPKKIGLHGHSWSGYQTAFAVTQTNMFAAAVSGAPVSNMTSAYSGIRHGSGLARQFQYEMGQSRIGESLYKAPQKYIENSPVFYVERIKTPMMIMFGDIDDAVPWEQGVEMYLAMRRAGKDVVFLQYEGEPHHLKKYPNKLDYTIKMRQYFDHYLLGKPAPMWLDKGEAYQEFAEGN